MDGEFYKFLGELISNLETKKFIVFVLSVIVFISLPTLLSLLKESTIVKKVKSFYNNNIVKIDEMSNSIINYQEESSIQIHNSLDKINDKLNILTEKNTNIIDVESVPSFVGPIYRNISLSVYKNVDLLMYEYDFKEFEKEVKIMIKRDISVRFKKAYLILSKYKLLNGHKLSFYVNEKWEHWLFKSIDELLFNSDIEKENIRIHLWNLLETSLDEFIDEFRRKMQ